MRIKIINYARIAIAVWLCVFPFDHKFFHHNPAELQLTVTVRACLAMGKVSFVKVQTNMTTRYVISNFKLIAMRQLSINVLFADAI